MVDTIEIKEALEKEMKRIYRRKWAVKLEEETGFTADYIRKYFKSNTNQVLIAKKAQQLVKEAKKSIKESIESIGS